MTETRFEPHEISSLFSVEPKAVANQHSAHKWIAAKDARACQPRVQLCVFGVDSSPFHTVLAQIIEDERGVPIVSVLTSDPSYDVLPRTVQACAKYLQGVQVGFDPWCSNRVVESFMAPNVSMIAVQNTSGSHSDALKELRARIWSRQIILDLTDEAFAEFEGALITASISGKIGLSRAPGSKSISTVMAIVNAYYVYRITERKP